MKRSIGEKISVCLLTYNHERVIESTLESILDQSIEGYEVLVSDDCSTDGTWERILQLAAIDSRVRPIRTPHNMGMPGNANFAVAHTERPYIALLHHDDIYRKDLFEKWAGVLERHPDVSFVFNRYIRANVENAWPPPFAEERLDGHWFLENFLFPRWGCPVRGTAMIRKTAWDKAGGMCERFNLIADVDLWMRLSAVSNVGYVAEALIETRALRPDYYPDIYTGKEFHWRRILLGYEIHASNRLHYLALNTLRGRLKWWRFRVRLNIETIKWLLYAIVKRRYEIISSSGESQTEYDLWPLRVFRRILHVAVRSPKGCLVKSVTRKGALRDD
jgi:glycosyltransferase involved in cell wall biosynthesis